MNRTFLILGIVAILAAASLLVVGSNPPAHIEATKIRVGYLPLIHGLPLYYATEKEYFKDAGLDVELIKFESPNQIIDALLQNNLDLGSTSTPLGITGIADYKNPGKLKIYAASGGDLDNPAEILLVSPDSNISSIGDLKGKKLGILGSSIQWRTIVRYMLDRNDLEMDKDVIIVELAPSLQVQALASKQIDALLALEPIATIAKEKGVGKESIRGPVEKIISNPFYGGAGVITEKFASENPNTTIKIIGIIARSIKEIDKNPEAAKPYLKGYTSLTDDLVNKVPIAIIKMCESLTEDDVNSIQKFYDIFTLYKVVDGKIDFNKISFCRAG
jgi:NitT/TauT family transport system substrate-binding protein